MGNKILPPTCWKEANILLINNIGGFAIFFCDGSVIPKRSAWTISSRSFTPSLPSLGRLISRNKMKTMLNNKWNEMKWKISFTFIILSTFFWWLCVRQNSVFFLENYSIRCFSNTELLAHRCMKYVHALYNMFTKHLHGGGRPLVLLRCSAFLHY